jgi:tetratricopeptide (TPR) repeat protein
MSPRREIPQNNRAPPLDLPRRLRKNSCRRMPPKPSEKKKLTATEQRELDTKIQFMEGLVRRDPDYVDALQLLGDHYTARGRFTEGLHVDEHLARLLPENPLVFYNLACSYSLTDEFDRAFFALDRAIELGYRDFKWLAKDPDLKKLRAQPAYEDIKEKIRRYQTEER